MALEVGDFVQKVTDSTVRGHVHQMDDGMMAVEVDGNLICGHQIDWEEVPSDAMEVQQSQSQQQQQDEPEAQQDEPEAQQDEPEAQQDDEASFFKRLVSNECQMSVK